MPWTRSPAYAFLFTPPNWPEPEVSEADGRIRVQRPGLTAEFNRATVTRGDEVVSLRLGSP